MIAWHADPDTKDFDQRLNSWREEPPVVDPYLPRR